MSKYHAKRTTVDGVTFASQKEARRYQELRLLQKASMIRGLCTQPRFPLYVAVSGDDPKRIGEYRGDFGYEEWQGKSTGDRFLHPASEHWVPVVEDVKGFKTPLYRWKKRHVEAQYGIRIRET